MKPTRRHGISRLRTVLIALATTPWVAIAQGAETDLPARGGGTSATPFPPITTTVSGAVPLAKDRPVALEYADSPKLTALLGRELSGRGVPLASAGAEHSVFVHVRGVLQLTGKHTVRIRIGELAEKGTLVESADGPRTLAPADVGYVIAAGDWLGRLVQTGQLAAPVGGFLLLDVVGQAIGAKDWFNSAVGGDRRGICLLNCEHWHKTRQAAFHVIEVRDGSGSHRVEVKSELFAEALQPGRVVSAGLQAVVETLADRPATAPAGSGDDRASAPD
jgi:hypothetical protein